MRIISGPVRRVAGILSTLLAAATVAAAVHPGQARADGDPASDALLGQNVFYPYDPPVPLRVQSDLQEVVNRAHRVTLAVKVALIARPADLGSITSLYGRPQQYAEFLEREISYEGPQPLLVVMYDGYGVEGFDGAAEAAASTLPRPRGTKGDDSTELAEAAAAAVRVLARADGHPLVPAAPVSSANGSGGGSRRELLIVMILVAVVIAALIFLLRLRQAVTEGPRRR